MNHIIVTRCFFDDDELFNKYFKMMELVYKPSINSQINSNFEIGFIISSKHSDKITELNLNVPILLFDSVKSFNEYCFEKNIEIQTRHDCDDWMRNDYIENIQKQFQINSKKYNSFLIQSQIYKHDIYSDKLYKPKLDYDDKNTSMFLSLCQKKVTNCVLDDNHRFMYKLVDKVIDLGYGYVKLTVHNNNKLSTILSGDRFIGNGKIDISVIIPTFNNVEYIDECISSIIRSCNGYNYEILIGIDNCSKTYNHIIKKYDLHDNKLQFYFFDKNVGPYIIKNSLIHKTNSDNILFFDSDDIIIENSVKLIIDNLNNFDMVRFKFYNFYNDLNNLEISTKHADGVFAINKNLFLSLNGYEPWMCGADSEMVWRVQSNNKKIKLINDCLFYRRRHNNSLTVKSDTNDTSQIRAKYRSILNDKKLRGNKGPLNSMVSHTNYRVTSNSPIKKIINEPLSIIPNKIVILSTLWNASKQIPQFIASIKSQTYKNFRVIIVDDNSTDGSLLMLQKLTSYDDRFTIIRNDVQKFKTQNFYEVIHNQNLINNDDIIIELDGDDAFYGNNVVEKVFNHFKDLNLWIAGYKWIDNRGQKSPFKYPPNADSPRSQVWSYSAMRVFKAFLFRNIKQSDLMFEGNFVRAANDVAYGMPMLEMSGKEHFRSFNDVTYLYNWHDKNTHSKTSSVRDTGLQKRTEKHIYSLPRYQKLELPNIVKNKQPQLPTSLPITNIANTEKLNDIKKIVTINKVSNDIVIPEPPKTIEVKKPEKIVKETNNKEIKNIISKIVFTPKENFTKHNPKEIKQVNKNNVIDKSKIENFEGRIKNNNPKIQFDDLIIKTQNKTEIDNKRKEFESIVLYGPKGKKGIKEIAPKNIGVSI